MVRSLHIIQGKQSDYSWQVKSGIDSLPYPSKTYRITVCNYSLNYTFRNSCGIFASSVSRLYIFPMVSNWLPVWLPRLSGSAPIGPLAGLSLILFFMPHSLLPLCCCWVLLLCCCSVGVLVGCVSVVGGCCLAGGVIAIASPLTALSWLEIGSLVLAVFGYEKSPSASWWEADGFLLADWICNWIHMYLL